MPLYKLGMVLLFRRLCPRYQIKHDLVSQGVGK
jgi:hypothetical protein